mgnify:CR=1
KFPRKKNRTFSLREKRANSLSLSPRNAFREELALSRVVSLANERRRLSNLQRESLSMMNDANENENETI